MERSIRDSWKKGSKCEIYSRSKTKWFSGTINRIFVDDEGEWLEVRYGKSMTKEVQRYSTDIRSQNNPSNMFNFHDLDLNDKYTQTLIEGYNRMITNTLIPTEINILCYHFLFFTEKADKMRKSWNKGDIVEVYSHSDNKWNVSEIINIVNDDEGEWLNCVWYRVNGQTMSKEVQRFSNDVRPIPDDSNQDKLKKHNKNQDKNININKKNNPFSVLFGINNIPTPIHATPSSLIRNRKLPDLIEIEETDQYIADNHNLCYNYSNEIKWFNI